jgi:putative acetyltransferase
MSRVIREYHGGDLTGVLCAWESGTAIAHPFLTEDFLEQEQYNIPNLYLPIADTWVVEDDGQVIGFMALLGNEVGAIFVNVESHHTGAGRALMDKAQDLHGELEVEVFKENSVGRRFYANYGFEELAESIHEPTGNALLRLKFSPK